MTKKVENELSGIRSSLNWVLLALLFPIGIGALAKLAIGFGILMLALGALVGLAMASGPALLSGVTALGNFLSNIPFIDYNPIAEARLRAKETARQENERVAQLRAWCSLDKNALGMSCYVPVHLLRK